MNKIGWVLLMAPAFLVLGACSSSRAPANEASGGGPATTVFGDELSLTGYSIGNKDGHTEIALRWKAVRKPSNDYLVFVHVLDGAGALAFQADHPLKNATGAPTSTWTVGESVEDRFLVTPPANRPAGTYALRIGVYVPSPMKVLQLAQAALPQPTDGWKNQAILIANVECK
jgi:hypothetical protein